MDYNLENRHRLRVLTAEEIGEMPLLKQLDLANEQLEAYEKWFEGFIKELKEMLDPVNERKQHPLICEFIKKEILGE